MKKKNKLLISLGTFCGVVAIAITTVYFSFLYSPKGHHVIDEWHFENEYSDKYISTLEKKENEDFTILNLTDIQISDFEPAGANRKMKKMFKELIDRTNPDLITLTGDQIWTDHSKNAFKRELRWFSGFKIPWAPVFGNHDGEGTASLDWQSDKLENAKYCLYKRGPSNIGGIGNYVINIKEGENIYKSLYMLDLGTHRDFTKAQVDFVKWNALANKENNNGNYPESMCFFHQAIDAYNEAWSLYKEDNSIAIGDVYRSFYIADKGTGEEFFETAKEINVKDIMCGHQHGNHFTIPYEGVRLSFGLKTGDMCSIYINDEGGDEFIVGASSITLRGSEVIYKSNYVGEEYRIKSK